MADVSDVITNIIDKDSVNLQDNFGQMMLDKIRDVVADRQAEVAQSFLGAITDDEPDSEPDEDEDLENADDIEAEADELGDEEDPTQDEGDTDEDA